MNILKELAELSGIASSYVDKTGKTHYTSDDVRRFFLNAMNIPSLNDAEIITSIKKQKHQPILPNTLAFYDNEQVVIPFKSEGKYKLTLEDEHQNLIWEHLIEDEQDVIINVSLSHGYYILKALKDGIIKEESLLIYAPVMCYQPEFIKNKEHLYGVSLMLYALRSKNSMGIGDFSDLKEIVKLTAANGGDAVGISPLGATSPYTLPYPTPFNTLRGDVSPYRTLSRLFISYAYLDLKEEEDYKNSKQIQELMDNTAAQDEINKLNNSEYVIYSAVLRLKLRILGLMYEQFQTENNQERHKVFNEYKKQKGQELENLCLFESLLEKHEESFWRYWHDGTEDFNSEVTAAFKANNKERIDFYAYCHWLADKQVKSVQALAKSLGMKIGLYADMPIGAASNGAEVWENPKAYVLEAGVGAPPDPICPSGQSWGFNPYNPLELPKQQYAPFIRLAHECMTYSGAVRIDHAMGLTRLFWVYFTEGYPTTQGSYINYDLKVMTAVLSLESNRAKCLLIGEDLGTVPAGFHEYMAEHGLLSYKIFSEEKDEEGILIAPQKYPYLSLAQSSTHDQATARGFWCNEDIEVFNNCHLYATEEIYKNSLKDRQQDRKNRIKAFAKEGVLTPELEQAMQQSAENGETIPLKIGTAFDAYGAKTNSALYFVRLCDIYEQKKMDNAPGTIDEHANWRLKLSHSIENIKQTDAFKQAMQIIKANRPK